MYLQPRNVDCRAVFRLVVLPRGKKETLWTDIFLEVTTTLRHCFLLKNLYINKQIAKYFIIYSTLTKSQWKKLLVSRKAALNTSICCQCVNLFLLKNFTKMLLQKKIMKKKRFCHILFFLIFYLFWCCHNFGFWVCSLFEFLSFVKMWFFLVLSHFKFLSFVTIWVFEFCHNLSFWVLSLLSLLSLL